MSAAMIDGRAVASRLRERIARETRQLKAETGIVPGLAAVLVGEDPASATYVRMKGRACEAAGFHSETVRLDGGIEQADLLAIIDRLNRDPAIHGILVQLPLPAGVDAARVTRAVDPAKDVDGFHPQNVGQMVLGAFDRTFVPATPAGIMHLLDDGGIELEGRDAVVVGRSDIVGKPVALLLLARSVTVTICHSRTRNLAEKTRRAEILVAAVGRPAMIKPEMVLPGAVVIDVGVNRVEDASAERGYRLVGDVDPSVAEIAGHLTPVPGGVGPMTIAMLLENTLKAARRAAGPAGDAATAS